MRSAGRRCRQAGTDKSVPYRDFSGSVSRLRASLFPVALFQPQRRRVCCQQLLLGAGLRVLQKLHSLHTGAEQFKVHGLVIRHGAHPLCISVGSLPRSLRPDTPELFSQTMIDT